MTNLTAVHITTVASVAVDHPTRIRGFNVANAKNALGVFELRDGTATSTGDSKIKININSDGSLDTYLADEGVRFESGVVVSTTASVYSTIYFG
jgi:hypothetical protein